MLNSAILDVAIGLIFIYLLLALICTTVNEWLSGIFQMRAKTLAKGIALMLGDQQLGATTFLDCFHKHPLISKLTDVPGSPPAYMAPRIFALTVMDLATGHQPGALTFADLQAGIESLPAGSVRTALLALMQNANSDIRQAQARIEGWFNDQMDRVSGWYTRRKQLMTVGLAVSITLFANADTFDMARKLWISPVLRQEVIDHAKSDSKSVTISDVQVQVGDVLGWAQTSFDKRLIWHIPGWLLTIVAVSLGAPFWFDTLNRFMNVRAAGKSPAEGAKGPRKDTSEEPEALLPLAQPPPSPPRPQ